VKAIISAAGWKGAGAVAGNGLAECPEPFLPLGDGTTTLSRTATILRDSGFEVYPAIGQRGYPYSRYIRWTCTAHLPEFGNDFPWDGSPWTQERYDYAAQFGTVLEMPDPGGWTMSLDTFCEAMDMMGEENWDHLFLAPGDMVVPAECFESMFTLDVPFVLSFTAYHSYFFFDQAGAAVFREYTEPFRRLKDEQAWLHDKEWAPTHWGTTKLRDAGFNVWGHDKLPEHKWTDIDIGPIYRKVRDRATNGTEKGAIESE
jgi:hypothetical protein